MVELDLLIIGGYYGEGKKRGIVSHFLVGLLNKGNLIVKQHQNCIQFFHIL